MAEEYLIRLGDLKRGQMVGNKAASLHRLRTLGMPVPAAFVLTAEAYRCYQRDDTAVIPAVLSEIERKLDLSKAYAVRSSANLEDSLEHSFAGQFKSVLNVRGKDALLQAIWSIWATTQTNFVREYLGKRGISAEDLRMAVIIQEMVEPLVSGVAFSRNPITGMHETVIEAVEGHGTRLVQEGITPLRWIYRSGSCTASPEDNPVPSQVIEDVARNTVRLAKRCKKALDLEWVFDGQRLYWLQMRDITTIRDVRVYSNHISRELMAGIIKPLIWSVNIPLVNGAWIGLLTEVIGPNDLDPNQLARPFYYRSYFNMGLLGEVFESLGFPAESLEMAWGIAPKGTQKFRFRPEWKALRLLPRLTRFTIDKGMMGRRVDRRLDALEAAYRAIPIGAVDESSSEALLEGIDRLFALTQEAAYYNILLPLLMYGYNATLRSQLKKAGVDYTLVDMRQDTPEFQRYNPGFHLEKLNRMFQDLDAGQQEQVCKSTFQDVLASPALDGFREALADLMDKFGHLCDNGNDFSSVPWRENGDTILRLVIQDHGQVVTRPGLMGERKPAETPAQKIDIESLRLPVWKGWMLRRLYRRTRRYNLYRERISYIYTFGYGLFRSYFMALGRKFQQAGLLDASEDILYLEWDQVRGVVSQGADPGELRAVVEGHKQSIEKVRSVQLPSVIYGDEAPPVETAASSRLSGVPTSSGYCTGRVRVVTGLQDFHKVKPGDILVIPYSDVGWTPLFACAAGVIAESGGILSHSSIIAREYGIPAVVSVPYAMQLADNTLVTMDGYKGEIIVHEEEENRACS